jgi:hypothetical protein
MSAAKKKASRFGYLAAPEDTTAEQPRDQNADQQQDGATQSGSETTVANADNGGGGEGESRIRGRSRSSRKPSTEGLVSVPKGQGRMKQERSQLNVRVPTTLKRQASAKAVLEGKDIGEVVEALLQQYLES